MAILISTPFPKERQAIIKTLLAIAVAALLIQAKSA